MWAHQLQSRALRGFRVSGWSTTDTVPGSKGTIQVQCWFASRQGASRRCLGLQVILWIAQQPQLTACNLIRHREGVPSQHSAQLQRS
ncbi:hypothetical protein C1X69_03600 [Pseudomonas sp. FW305-67]|nr:hypothetical protein C1X70_09160 [Pseudomonas sp. FW305-53]PMY86689.1 hypothetical protein C1X68_12980 [Pseudomonas sp. FW303-C2]PMY94626.1 hypothetical protein C1X67_03660 [Pseudomonas sp. FW305-62]PNA45156.1 hypothetical protein C1X71_05805 [Pseudomonas sp. FW306-2-2C-A10BC]PNA84978.1 hypothetical protein C1X66_18135 [Pseudomonas sp. MPR-R3B]PNB23251.1 hypothetical protein C1X69_03600 [Pseudomonas sp. FW305-67]